VKAHRKHTDIILTGCGSSYNLFFLGSGVMKGLADEWALKMTEMAACRAVRAPVSRIQARPESGA
jgi:fructoselysine-6-P-deglycase FrlB-like protein